jgi:RimJ/RimL family protein N-acetyltransferase
VVSVVFHDPLVTERLVLRRLEHHDVAPLCAYRSLESVARYQSWESFDSDAAARLVEGQLTRQPGVPGTWFQLAIVDRATGVMAGDCGLYCRDDDPRQMEIGVTLAPDFQRRGLAAEAVGCVLDYIFGVLGKHRVSATTDAENHRAAALFRGLGFRQEAHFVDNVWFKGKWGSEFGFALLKREWECRA